MTIGEIGNAMKSEAEKTKGDTLTVSKKLWNEISQVLIDLDAQLSMLEDAINDVESINISGKIGERDYMKKWDIEMAYGINFSVQVGASSLEEAIAVAKSLVENGTTVLPFDNAVDESGLMFQEVTYFREN